MRVALVLAGAVIVLAGCSRAVTGEAMAPPDTRPWADEDQIAEVVSQFEQAWNDREFDTLRGLMCAEMQSSDEFDEDALREARSESDRLKLQITELEVSGDSATAIIENNGDDPDDIVFQREDDEWKWCEF